MMMVERRDDEPPTPWYDRPHEGCAGLLIAVGISAASLPAYGVAIAQLWAWFAVPIGAVPITPAMGAGLRVLAMALRPLPGSAEPVTPIQQAVMMIVVPVALLALGSAMRLLAIACGQ